MLIIIIIIIDNFCIALFSGVPKFTALYNILRTMSNDMQIRSAKMHSVKVFEKSKKFVYVLWGLVLAA